MSEVISVVITKGIEININVYLCHDRNMIDTSERITRK